MHTCNSSWELKPLNFKCLGLALLAMSGLSIESEGAKSAEKQVLPPKAIEIAEPDLPVWSLPQVEEENVVTENYSARPKAEDRGTRKGILGTALVGLVGWLFMWLRRRNMR